MKVALDYPITIQREGKSFTLDEVTISRLKGKHLRELPPDIFNGEENKSVAAMLPLIKAMCNLSDAEVDELDFADMIKIGGEVTSFLAQSPPIGKS